MELERVYELRDECNSLLDAAVNQDWNIFAVDTEYSRQPDGTVTVTEVGLSRWVGKRVRTQHYVIGGGKGAGAQPFRFGATQRYPLGKFLTPLLQSLLAPADLVLFWEKNPDLEALAALGVTLPQHKVLDLACWQMRPPTYAGGGYSRYSLREWCALQGVQLLGAHCAGNDSHGLLLAALSALGVVGQPLQMTEVTHASS